MHRKKIFAVTVFISLIVFGIAATTPPDEPKHKNLKILPKNISKEDLDKIMDGFKEALGVKCNFCHAPEADSSHITWILQAMQSLKKRLPAAYDEDDSEDQQKIFQF